MNISLGVFSIQFESLWHSFFSQPSQPFKTPNPPISEVSLPIAMGYGCPGLCKGGKHENFIFQANQTLNPGDTKKNDMTWLNKLHPKDLIDFSGNVAWMPCLSKKYAPPRSLDKRSETTTFSVILKQLPKRSIYQLFDLWLSNLKSPDRACAIFEMFLLVAIWSVIQSIDWQSHPNLIHNPILTPGNRQGVYVGKEASVKRCQWQNDRSDGRPVWRADDAF